ncbi:MAG: EAL and HDOD domain-containing protein [Leptothrix sp. (in: b-proteobacteria)]
MDLPIFDRVVLNYCPVIDRQRHVLATRLTVFPVKPGRWLPVGELLRAVTEVWPITGPAVALSVRSESLLADLMVIQPTSNVMLEIPKFMAADERHLAAIQTLAANGNTLLLSGRPDQPLAREVLECFKYSIIDLADERRIDSGEMPCVKRTIGFFQDGVSSVADMEGAFRRGAVAVLGWPIDEVVRSHAHAHHSAARPDLQATIELINLVDREEPLERLEAMLRKEPTLAFKLMRYINSPVFGLSVEISSFSHAVMLLGYQRLKRWLALLLVTADSDPNLRPVMFAAVRRGLLMEALADPTDDAQRSEMFICGVFSLLDRMFQQSFAELLRTIPVPEAVYSALADGAGPYERMIKLVRSLEGGAGLEIREAARDAGVGLRTVNQALLGALSDAGQLVG